MDNACGTKACGWLMLIAIVAGFAAIYHLVDSRLPAVSTAAKAQCDKSKEIKLSDYGDLVSLSQDGGILRVVMGKADEGVYNSISIDTCDNKVLNKVVIRTK